MSQTLQTQDIFTRISDASEKTRLFHDLAVSKSELVAKKPDPSADILVLMAFDFSHDRLNCKILGASSGLLPAGPLILTCFVGGEKYFFQTDYKIVGETLSLSTSGSLFHLQRREDYRIRVPSTYRALFEVVAINGKTKKTPIPLVDLSGGGCRFQVDPKILPLKVHDELKGHLFFPDRAPIPLVASIRHIRADNQGKGTLSCGLQFVGMTELQKNRIVAVVMDLYREHFAGRP